MPEDREAFNRSQEALATAQQRIAELERERDEARAMVSEYRNSAAAYIASAEQRIADLEASIVTHEEALRAECAANLSLMERIAVLEKAVDATRKAAGL